MLMGGGEEKEGKDGSHQLRIGGYITVTCVI